LQEKKIKNVVLIRRPRSRGLKKRGGKRCRNVTLGWEEPAEVTHEHSGGEGSFGGWENPRVLKKKSGGGGKVAGKDGGLLLGVEKGRDTVKQKKN